MSPDQTPGIGNPRAAANAGEFERLLRELRDFNDGVREKAALRLGEIGNKEAVQPLIGRLNNDKSSRVQWYAADALHKIGDAQAWPAIQQKLESQTDDKVKAKCAEVLGLSGDKNYADVLVNALRVGGETAKQAVIGLGRLKTLSILDKLIENIDENSSYYEKLKDSTVMALIEIGTDVIKQVLETSGSYYGDPYRVKVLSGLGQNAISQIVSYVNAQNIKIRSVVAQSLSQINSADSTKYLCNIVKTEKEHSIRNIALDALEQRPAGQVDSALIYVLQNDPYEGHRAKSAKILGKLKVVAALDPLCQIALRDYASNQFYANREAITTLGLLGDQRAIPTLGSLLMDCIDYEARKLAAEAIANTKSSAGFEYLVSALGSDGNATVRQASALALGQLRDRRAIEPLRQVSTSDPDSSVKEAAKSALKNI